MAVPRYYWRDSRAVGTLIFMARFPLLFFGVLAGLFAIKILKPVQKGVIQPFTGLLRGSPLWESLAADIKRASARA